MLNFSFDHILWICTFSEILMSNNSYIAIFPYSYILCLDGILLDMTFIDFKLILAHCILTPLRQQVNCD